MLRTSLSLQRLPRIMFSGAAPSRYIIKRQPEPGCLSTLEAAHELLLTLDRAGLDRYAQPEQMLDLFRRMQEFQISRTEENRRLGIRRHARKPSFGQRAGGTTDRAEAAADLSGQNGKEPPRATEMVPLEAGRPVPRVSGHVAVACWGFLAGKEAEALA